MGRFLSIEVCAALLCFSSWAATLDLKECNLPYATVGKNSGPLEKLLSRMVSEVLPPMDEARYPTPVESWKGEKRRIYEQMDGEGHLGHELVRVRADIPGQVELEFRKNGDIVRSDELGPPPESVLAQKEQLHQWLKKEESERGASQGYAPNMELPNLGRPRGKILSRKTLAQVDNGAYSFVQIKGERFLRLATSNQEGAHQKAGAGEDVSCAGEIFIDRKPDGFLSVSLNLKSGLYTPDVQTALSHAVEALWAQGIYPKEIRLYARVRPIERMHETTTALLLTLKP